MAIIPNIRAGCWHFESEDPSEMGLIDAICPSEELTPKQRSELDTLVNQSFEGMGTGLGCTNAVEHKIKTNSDPIK